MLANEAPDALDGSRSRSTPQVAQHPGRQIGNTFDSTLHAQPSRYQSGTARESLSRFRPPSQRPNQVLGTYQVADGSFGAVGGWDFGDAVRA